MKRFVNTERWSQAWFNRLNPVAKLCLIYIQENCDAAGVWVPDYDTAQHLLGYSNGNILVNWESEIAAINSGAGQHRIEKAPDGALWLTRFCHEQYSSGNKLVLCETTPLYKPVLRSLRQHGLFERFLELYPNSVISERPKPDPFRLVGKPPSRTMLVNRPSQIEECIATAELSADLVTGVIPDDSVNEIVKLNAERKIRQKQLDSTPA